MELDRTLALRAVVWMTTVTFIAVVIAAIFAPDAFDRVVSTILTIAVPTTAALLALLQSTRNSGKLTIIDEKATQAKVEASAAKVTAAKTEVKIDQTRAAVQAVRNDTAATVAIVEEHVPAIAQKVEEIKQEGGQGGHTPPHGTKKL